MTSHVGRVDWSFTEALGGTTATSSGLGRRVLVGRDQGAIHTELAVGALAPGGWLAPHVHSFEEALYVLDGELILELDRRVHRLVRGDYAVMPVGLAPHPGQRRRRAGSLAVGQLAATARTGRRSQGHVLRTATGRRGARRVGDPPALRRPDAAAGRPLRRDAAAAGSAGGQGRRPRSERRRGWIRRSSPTAGSP